MHWKEIKTIGTERNNDGLGTNYQFFGFKFISHKIGFFYGKYDNVIGNDSILNRHGVMSTSIKMLLFYGRWMVDIIGKKTY